MPILRPGDVVTIDLGEPVGKEAIAVIAPGAGSGESFLAWDVSQYVAQSSEGGHSDFAPADQRQIRSVEYMLNLFDHVSFGNASVVESGFRTSTVRSRQSSGFRESREWSS